MMDDRPDETKESQPQPHQMRVFLNKQETRQPGTRANSPSLSRTVRLWLKTFLQHGQKIANTIPRQSALI